ncbi:hypothetical protein BT96DRAFT_1006653 [Gymnopus androsaceus JB14]|uniref:Uncharacterized protein n=1 Tax=Gymnopus androsaceus JB14 TaxID=1447944 RepID=A0A6A4GJR0_9AGAR|nr:hypothetical protein BT96DRAFT_1006653 [Gymnopus androsaceus JB14]
MSPEKKLQWFGNHGWSQEENAKVTEHVLNHWSESYMHLPTVARASSTTSVAPAPMLVNLDDTEEEDWSLFANGS